MELVLIRHGLPVRSHESSDPPLADEGLEQARRVASWLAHEHIDVVVSSPMLRAIQTAEPFAAMKGHAVQPRPGIEEFDRNTGTYIPMEELKRDDYPRWKAMAEGGLDVDIVGFQRLVVETLEAVIRENPGKRVAVFCHGGVINVWTAHVLGMAPRLFFEPGYTSVHRFLCASSGQRNVLALNERHHLHPKWPATEEA